MGVVGFVVLQNFGVGQKDGVSGVGRSFRVGGVGLLLTLLKISKNLQEKICARVSS